jgi:hypothetical protein
MIGKDQILLLRPSTSTPAVHSFASQSEFEDYGKLIEEFARQGTRPA